MHTCVFFDWCIPEGFIHEPKAAGVFVPGLHATSLEPGDIPPNDTMKLLKQKTLILGQTGSMESLEGEGPTPKRLCLSPPETPATCLDGTQPASWMETPCLNNALVHGGALADPTPPMEEVPCKQASTVDNQDQQPKKSQSLENMNTKDLEQVLKMQLDKAQEPSETDEAKNNQEVPDHEQKQHETEPKQPDQKNMEDTALPANTGDTMTTPAASANGNNNLPSNSHDDTSTPPEVKDDMYTDGTYWRRSCIDVRIFLLYTFMLYMFLLLLAG